MNVKSIVKEYGYTLTDVAKKMGISRVTLSQNLDRNPTYNTLKRIADAVGCKVGDFFRDEMSPMQENELTIFVEYKGQMLHTHSREEFETFMRYMDIMSK